MKRIQQTARAALVATAVLAAGAAQAAISVTSATDVASFSALVSGSVDALSDLAINSYPFSPQTRSVGGLDYDVSATNGLFVASAAGTVALGTLETTDTLNFEAFSMPVYAFGGNFFATNVLGELRSGGITLQATDINGLSATATLAGNSLTGFAGFVSDAPLASITVGLSAPSDSAWATADNIVTAVPEPGAWAMMLAGGLVVLRLQSRRRPS